MIAEQARSSFLIAVVLLTMSVAAFDDTVEYGATVISAAMGAELVGAEASDVTHEVARERQRRHRWTPERALRERHVACPRFSQACLEHPMYCQ